MVASQQPCARLAGLLLLLLLLSATADASSSSCECIDVQDSWGTFRTAIAAAASVGKMTRSRPHVLFCPFDIEKAHDADTDHEKQMLTLASSVHLQCYKANPDDKCVIESVGPACTRKTKCTQLISVEADDVWMQGFTVKGTQVGAVTVGARSRGIKLIDMEFDGNSSPEETSGAVVFADLLSSTEIVDSVFSNSYGTALQNYGSMIVVNCKFINNLATPYWMSNDVEVQGGGVGGAVINSEGGMLFLSGSTFIGNEADSNAPAFWSYDGSGIDGGRNCGLNNRVSSTDTLCDGIYYMTTRICKKFGGGSCEAQEMANTEMVQSTQGNAI